MNNNLEDLIEKIEIWVAESRYVFANGKTTIDYNVPFDLLWLLGRTCWRNKEGGTASEGSLWSLINQVVEIMNEAGYETPEHIKNQIIINRAFASKNAIEFPSPRRKIIE